MSHRKVFGVGLPKTGTTSLEKAHEMLGYRVCRGHFKNNHTGYLIAVAVNGDDVEIIRFTALFDAFFDVPWGGTGLYRALFNHQPDARFILSKRDPDDWAQSLLAMAARTALPAPDLMTGVYKAGAYAFVYWLRNIVGIGQLEGSERELADYCRKYNDETLSFLISQGADHLIFDVTDGDDWHRLCTFLEKPIPDSPFPKLNQAGKPKPTVIDSANLANEVLRRHDAGEKEAAIMICKAVLKAMPDDRFSKFYLRNAASQR